MEWLFALCQFRQHCVCITLWPTQLCYMPCASEVGVMEAYSHRNCCTSVHKMKQSSEFWRYWKLTHKVIFFHLIHQHNPLFPHKAPPRDPQRLKWSFIASQPPHHIFIWHPQLVNNDWPLGVIFTNIFLQYEVCPHLLRSRGLCVKHVSADVHHLLHLSMIQTSF